MNKKFHVCSIYLIAMDNLIDISRVDTVEKKLCEVFLFVRTESSV